MSLYFYTFSPCMVLALLDVATMNGSAASTRWRPVTFAALERRKLIAGDRFNPKVTPRGHAWIKAFGYELKHDPRLSRFEREVRA